MKGSNFKNERSDKSGWIEFSKIKGETASGWIEGIAMFCPTACLLIPSSTPRNPGRLVSGLSELIKVFSSPYFPFLSFGHGTASRPKANRLNVSWGKVRVTPSAPPPPNSRERREEDSPLPAGQVHFNAINVFPQIN